MRELISVIVPVYNVEKYLGECIESLICQTYTNIEILLVNDGATDSSPKICNYYQKIDQRIKVINTENGGLSAARNMGIANAKGAYFAFVDSDDFIEATMLETLFAHAEKSSADIVCCNYDFYSETSKFQKTHKIKNRKNMLYTSAQARDVLLYNNYYRCYAWNKLFRAELFEKIRFPEGCIYEDILTSYLLLEKANNILYITDDLYHYRIRSNSITRKICPEKLYQILYPIREIRKRTGSKSVLIGSMLYYMFFFNDMVKCGKWDNGVYKEFKELVHGMISDILLDKNLEMKSKISLLLYYCNRNVYVFAYRFYLKCSS